MASAIQSTRISTFSGLFDEHFIFSQVFFFVVARSLYSLFWNCVPGFCSCLQQLMILVLPWQTTAQSPTFSTVSLDHHHLSSWLFLCHDWFSGTKSADDKIPKVPATLKVTADNELTALYNTNRASDIMGKENMIKPMTEQRCT